MVKKIFLLILLLVSYSFAETIKIDVLLNNQLISTNLELINSAGYISIDDVEKYYLPKMELYKASRKVLLNFNNNIVILCADDNNVKINNENKNLNKSVLMINDEIFVPLELLLCNSFSDVSETDTSWDFDKKLLTVNNRNFKVENQNITNTTGTINEQEDKKIEKNKVPGINLIVVDAGHGGKDSGALSVNKKNREKDINLKVALLLKKHLESNGKKVILTRDQDVFIPLEDRPKVANDNKADLFISIHSNAAPNARSRRGFEVYILSENASDAESQEVANLENSVLSFENKTQNIGVESILLSMSLNTFMNESSECGYFICRNILNNVGIATREVKQAGFVVLRGSRMPAVLVELSYMTNAKDLKLLRDGKVQDKMAKSIAKAVLDYEKRLKNK